MALSPMMQHYVAMKEQYPDCVLFYRLGDFYEMFFDDAVEVSRVLELTLTGRDCGLPERAPMCGVPFHAAEGYITQLVEKGYKVAICEQVEDPKDAKGMVRREVVRIVTPGTILRGQDAEEDRNHYIMSIVSAAGLFGVALADVSTGQCQVTEYTEARQLADEIRRRQPAEIICNRTLFLSDLPLEELRTQIHISVTALGDDAFAEETCTALLSQHFRTDPDQVLGLSGLPAAKCAAGALFRYLYDTQMNEVGQMTSITPIRRDQFMALDASTRYNLELVRTIREKEKRGSLLWVLDRTETAMGARLLRSRIEQPLLDAPAIERRLDAVQSLAEHPMERAEIREYLHPVYDLERLTSRIMYQSATPRDLIAFRDSLAMVPPIRQLLTDQSGEELKKIREELDPLEDICALIHAAICDDPPLAMRDGGIIRDGYDEEVDRCRRARTEGKQWISDLEEAERERTGIRNLRIKYNKVFGYYLEVTNSYKDRVPADYQRRQTLANAERYTTDALKEMEETILGAEERLAALEYSIFTTVRDTVAGEVVRIQQTARAIAALDVHASLAEVACRERFVRPTLNVNGEIHIREGRHPVVEKMLGDENFIANDTDLDLGEQRVAVITGPNMAGKSTYMRQTALIVLLAQIGSFVPASSADIGIVDRIFTRVGASDDLASGQSTFMVEMSEVANILQHATRNSLLILDEIGRGTSTFDGLSIAWAVIEYIADRSRIGAKTLFATHYHELTELEGKLDGVQNYCIAVKERGESIVFLRKIVRGGADRSYGIQVARLAGVPEDVLARARELSEQLSNADITAAVKTMAGESAWQAPATQPHQYTLFEPQGADASLSEALLSLDPSNMTPLQALGELYRLQELAKEKQR